MIQRIIDSRLVALAVLAFALLANALHAAEHGVGEHDHEGVPCLVGALIEDDVLALPTSATVYPLAVRSAVAPAAKSFSRTSRIGILFPPATGPPVFT